MPDILEQLLEALGRWRHIAIVLYLGGFISGAALFIMRQRWDLLLLSVALVIAISIFACWLFDEC